MNAESPSAAPGSTPPRIEVTTSRMFNFWVARQKASLVLTTYQTGKIFLLGLQAQLQMTGSVQTLEIMSADIGPVSDGLDRTFAGHYPIRKLRIGPAPTIVDLVDNDDNDDNVGIVGIVDFLALLANWGPCP